MNVALVGMSVLAAASVQSGTGLGFALVLTPVVLALLSPTTAVVLITGLGLVLNLLVLVTERRRPRVAWREVVPILGAALPGTVCGVLVLRALSKPALQLAVGVVLLGALLLERLRGRRRHAGARDVPARLGVGFATGVLSTSAGVSGPPIALWLSRTALSPAEVRDSLSAAFLALGVIAALALVPVLHRAHLEPAVLAAGLAGVLGGHAIGRRAFSRLHDQRFASVLRAVIACAGAASIVAGASGL